MFKSLVNIGIKRNNNYLRNLKTAFIRTKFDFSQGKQVPDKSDNRNNKKKISKNKTIVTTENKSTFGTNNESIVKNTNLTSDLPNFIEISQNSCSVTYINREKIVDVKLRFQTINFSYQLADNRGIVSYTLKFNNLFDPIKWIEQNIGSKDNPPSNIANLSNLPEFITINRPVYPSYEVIRLNRKKIVKIKLINFYSLLPFIRSDPVYNIELIICDREGSNSYHLKFDNALERENWIKLNLGKIA